MSAVATLVPLRGLMINHSQSWNFLNHIHCARPVVTIPHWCGFVAKGTRRSRISSFEARQAEIWLLNDRSDTVTNKPKLGNMQHDKLPFLWERRNSGTSSDVKCHLDRCKQSHVPSCGQEHRTTLSQLSDRQLNPECSKHHTEICTSLICKDDIWICRRNKIAEITKMILLLHHVIWISTT